MSTSRLPSDRFRSATDFPKNIQSLNRPEADALYAEMRDCLIFTNRSRAQLIRRNQEHKDKTGLLKGDVQRLQGMIQQLNTDKQRTLQEQQTIISALETEMTVMANRLDDLSVAFDGISDVETPEQTHWSLISMPARFFRFLQAVKAVVMWWRQDRPQDDATVLEDTSRTKLSLQEGPEADNDRREKPQMSSDQASINRSLLDR